MERVEFLLGFSRVLLILSLILHLGSIFVLIHLPILNLLKILGTALLILHGWLMLKLHVLRRHKNAIVKIWQDKNGKWGCETCGGHHALGGLEGESYITSFFMVLRFRFKTRVENVVIPIDALTTHQYRVLSTRLRFFT